MDNFIKKIVKFKQKTQSFNQSIEDIKVPLSVLGIFCTGYLFLKVVFMNFSLYYISDIFLLASPFITCAMYLLANFNFNKRKSKMKQQLAQELSDIKLQDKLKLISNYISLNEHTHLINLSELSLDSLIDHIFIYKELYSQYGKIDDIDLVDMYNDSYQKNLIAWEKYENALKEKQYQQNNNIKTLFTS